MHSDISWYAEQVNCGDAIVAVSPAQNPREDWRRYRYPQNYQRGHDFGVPAVLPMIVLTQ